MPAVPKPRPKFLERAGRRAAIDALDKDESQKARARANGRCEVFVIGEGLCSRVDSHTHHMIGGIGRRKLGRSALSLHKQRVCAQHHKLITGHVLKLVPEGKLPIWTDVYQRWTA
mgnify:CR=1 FL=1